VSENLPRCVRQCRVALEIMQGKQTPAQAWTSTLKNIKLQIGS